MQTFPQYLSPAISAPQTRADYLLRRMQQAAGVAHSATVDVEIARKEWAKLDEDNKRAAADAAGVDARKVELQCDALIGVFTEATPAPHKVGEKSSGKPTK